MYIVSVLVLSYPPNSATSPSAGEFSDIHMLSPDFAYINNKRNTGISDMPGVSFVLRY